LGSTDENSVALLKHAYKIFMQEDARWDNAVAAHKSLLENAANSAAALSGEELSEFGLIGFGAFLITCAICDIYDRYSQKPTKNNESDYSDTDSDSDDEDNDI
jgi:hypothetical protein